MARKSSSQVPPLRTASFLWKEAEYCSHSEGLRYENAASPHSSFRANARNLFRSRSSKSRRTAGNGKHRASYDLKARCFMQADSRMKQIMANEKDPSAPLGMTMRGKGIVSQEVFEFPVPQSLVPSHFPKRADTTSCFGILSQLPFFVLPGVDRNHFALALLIHLV